MEAMTVEQIYEQQIKPLPLEQRMRLVELIARDAAQVPGTPETPRRSIMELHGLGAEIWEGIDAQEYVNELRKEWDHRP